MLATRMTVNVTGDREMFERGSKRYRDLSPFFRAIAVHASNQALVRLTQVLSQEDAGVRSGRLTGSVSSGKSRTIQGALAGVPLGSGNEFTILQIGKAELVVGTNLIYAAQVQFGGTILPVNAKALAIPLDDRLKRDGLGPREIDTAGDVLRFQPISGRSPNVFAVLIDEEGELGYGKGPVFALAYWVTQQPRPFLFIDEEDLKVIREDIWPAFVGMS